MLQYFVSSFDRILCVYLGTVLEDFHELKRETMISLATGNTLTYSLGTTIMDEACIQDFLAFQNY